MENTIYSTLNKIQTALNAPKNQKNSFGNYNYRSAEDILEALKPLLKETKTSLVLSDSVECREGRFYIKAVATLYDESGSCVSALGFAREEESKKGYDAAQLTGATSSYARKYALNGLFAIDDNKDFDATGKGEGKTNKPEVVRKGAAPEPQQPSNEGGDGIFDSPELQDAIEAAKNAETPEELTKVWKDWKPKFGTYHEFVDAVKNNPNHPSHKK